MKSWKTHTTACMISNKPIFLVLFFTLSLLSGCALPSRGGYDRSTGTYTTKSEQVSKSGKKKTVKKAKIGSVLHGEASYYGPGFEGNLTANGETFDSSEMTCAHKSLPFNTWLRVTRVDTGESVVVRVNDRGPYAKGRILDLSAAAGKKIGLDKVGHAEVRAEVIEGE
jgi:rare lipoprotein A